MVRFCTNVRPGEPFALVRLFAVVTSLPLCVIQHALLQLLVFVLVWSAKDLGLNEIEF